MKKSVAGKIISAMFASILLVTMGCGGGGGGGGASAPTVLTGVAAAGSVIVGTVTLKDSANPPHELTTTTGASIGSYSFDVTGLTKPFMIRVVGNVGSTPYTLYSLSADGGTANVNPMTSLVVSYAAGWADLATVYGASGAPLASNIGTIAGGLDQAVANIQATLPTLNASVQAALQAHPNALSVNPITVNYQVDGASNASGLDALLDDLQISVAGSTLTINKSGTNLFNGDVAGLVAHSVTGKVTLVLTGAGLPQCTVTVTNAVSGTVYGSAVTDSTGAYTVNGVPQVGYIVAVTPRSGFTFDPPSVTLSAGNFTPVAFLAAPYGTLYGTVTDSKGVPFPGVLVTAKVSGSSVSVPKQTVTGADGRYSFTGLGSGKSYDVSVAKTDYYNNAVPFVFDASTKTITVNTTASAIGNFSAPGVTLLAISGNIINVDPDANGVPKNTPMANVQVTLSLRSTSTKDLSGGSTVLISPDAYATTTDSNGNYSFNVPSGFYQFSLVSGSYGFALTTPLPKCQEVGNMLLTSSQTLNFNGQTATGSVSGGTQFSPK